MLEVADLETGLLDFVQKSFGFDRVVELDGDEFAVFERTETESEAKFRPRLVKLWVLVPRAMVVRDFASDLLVIASDGHTPGPRATATALETAAEKTAFREQGVDWQRTEVPEVGFVYLPAASAAKWGHGSGRERLRAALRKT